MKAVCLFSGGLDSQLAAYLVKMQEIEVVGVYFQTPFSEINPNLKVYASHLGIDLAIIKFGAEYIEEVLLQPRYGYGKNLNPCIDCHAYMLRRAGEHMQRIGASFLVTGEVLGQRPMSQNKSSLQLVEKLSGYPGLILRPLSAQLLPPSLPEQRGWIKTDQLLDINGRGRQRQIALAARYNIADYPTPAGGCLLTEPGFARRLKELLKYRQQPALGDIELLKVGRHFHLDPGHLLVVGRNRAENEVLTGLAAKDDILIRIADRPGPTGLLRNLQTGTADLEYAAAIVARYSDAKTLPSAKARLLNHHGSLLSELQVVPLTPEMTPATV